MKFLDSLRSFWKNQSRNYKVFITRDMINTLFGNVAGTYSSIYMRTLGATTNDIGLLTSILSLVRLILSIPGGIITDRAQNIKKLYLSGRLLQLPVNLIVAFSPNYYIYSLTRIWEVITFRITMPTSNVISIASMSNRDRIKSLVMNRTLLSAGGLFAPLLAAWAVTYFGGLDNVDSFRPLFIIQFIVSVLVFLLSYTQLEEPQYNRRNRVERNPIKSTIGILSEYPGLKRMLIFDIVNSLFINIRMPFIQLYFYEIKKADAFLIGWQGTISTAMILLLSMPLGAIIDKYGRRKMSYIGQIVLAICVLAAVMTPLDHPELILVYSFLSGLGSCFDIGWQAFVQEYVPLEARGIWTGLSTTATALIGIPAPIIGSMIWYYNPDLLWWISFFYYLILAIPLMKSIPEVQKEELIE